MPGTGRIDEIAGSWRGGPLSKRVCSERRTRAGERSDQARTKPGRVIGDPGRFSWSLVIAGRVVVQQRTRVVAEQLFDTVKRGCCSFESVAIKLKSSE